MKKLISVLLTGVFIMSFLFNALFAGAAVKKTEILKKAIPDRTVVLTFDDGMMNHYRNVVPELQSRGFGGTFYISEISFAAYGTTNYADGVKKGVYMTWDKVKEIADMGFEIGNHSMTHPDLTLMTIDQIKAEIKGIEDKCAQYGIEKPTSFAYPGLLYTKKIATALKSMGYITARSGIGPTYDPLEDDPFKIMSTDDDGNLVYSSFVRQVNEAKDGKAVVLIYHDVPNRSVFARTMDYLKNNDFNVIAMRDLAEYIDFDKAGKYFDENPEAGMKPTYSANKTSFAYPGDYSVDSQGKEGFYYMYLDANGELQYGENMGYYWGPNDPDEFFCRISNTLMHPGNNANPVLKWIAPEEGTVKLTGNVKKTDRVADDVVFSVSRGNEKLIEQTVTTKSPLELSLSSVKVSKGEAIFFSLVCPTNKGGANDVKINIDFKAANAGVSSSATATSSPAANGDKTSSTVTSKPAGGTTSAPTDQSSATPAVSDTQTAETEDPSEIAEASDIEQTESNAGDSEPDTPAEVGSSVQPAADDGSADRPQSGSNPWLIVCAAVGGAIVIAAAAAIIISKKKKK